MSFLEGTAADAFDNAKRYYFGESKNEFSLGELPTAGSGEWLDKLEEMGDGNTPKIKRLTAAFNLMAGILDASQSPDDKISPLALEHLRACIEHIAKPSDELKELLKKAAEKALESFFEHYEAGGRNYGKEITRIRL